MANAAFFYRRSIIKSLEYQVLSLQARWHFCLTASRSVLKFKQWCSVWNRPGSTLSSTSSSCCSQNISFSSKFSLAKPMRLTSSGEKLHQLPLQLLGYSKCTKKCLTLQWGFRSLCFIEHILFFYTLQSAFEGVWLHLKKQSFHISLPISLVVSRRLNWKVELSNFQVKIILSLSLTASLS